VKMPGPGPDLNEMMSTARRYTVSMFEAWSTPSVTNPSSVTTTTTATPSAYGRT